MLWPPLGKTSQVVITSQVELSFRTEMETFSPFSPIERQAPRGRRSHRCLAGCGDQKSLDHGLATRQISGVKPPLRYSTSIRSSLVLRSSTAPQTVRGSCQSMVPELNFCPRSFISPTHDNLRTTPTCTRFRGCVVPSHTPSFDIP